MSRATEWKERAREAARAEAVELELPSGVKILARRPDPIQLAAWGKLPMLLAAAAMGSQNATPPSMEEAAEIAGLYRDVLVYCCVDPRVSLDPQGEDEIHPRDMCETDWRFVCHWGLRVVEARALEGFRRQRADAGDCGDGKAVLDKTF